MPGLSYEQLVGLEVRLEFLLTLRLSCHLTRDLVQKEVHERANDDTYGY
jgi:hypothetical protein